VRVRPVVAALAAFILGGALIAVGVAHADKIGPGDFDNPTLINFENAPSGPIGGFYSALGVSFVNLGGGPIFNTGTGNGPSKVVCNFVGVPPSGPPPGYTPGPPPGYTPGPPPGYTPKAPPPDYTPSPPPGYTPGPPPGYTPGPPPGYTPGPPPGYTPGPPPGYTPGPPPPRPPSELLFNSDVDRAGFYITSDNQATTTVTAYYEGSQVGSEVYATGGQGASGSFIGVEFSSEFDRLVVLVQATVGYGGGFCIDDLRFEGEGIEPPGPTKEPSTQPTATATPEVIIIVPPNTGSAGLK
jgi:hypothetical protein